jgi:hypothetical protein
VKRSWTVLQPKYSRRIRAAAMPSDQPLVHASPTPENCRRQGKISVIFSLEACHSMVMVLSFAWFKQNSRWRRERGLNRQLGNDGQ